MEDMLNTDEKIERKSIGEQDMSREWKICATRMKRTKG
jgi:hypothetical protein